MGESLDNPQLFPSLVRWWRQETLENGTSTTICRFLAAFWDFALESTPSHRRQRYGDVDYDWDHRVDTTGAAVGWRERLLGALHSPYQPTDAALFHEMLAGIQIDFREFTFIDLGSGKGRTLLMASDYPFRRILGVELLPELHRIAEENIRVYRKSTQLCSDIHSVCADAREFEFPAEPTLLYLFNPLPAVGLSSVLEHLRASLQRAPRQFYVLYHNPEHGHLLERCVFLQKTSGTHQYSVYVAISCNP
jgi:SAM-dependent methyltransferase